MKPEIREQDEQWLTDLFHGSGSEPCESDETDVFTKQVMKRIDGYKRKQRIVKRFALGLAVLAWSALMFVTGNFDGVSDIKNAVPLSGYELITALLMIVILCFFWVVDSKRNT